MTRHLDHPELGPCCACGGHKRVRNIVMLDQRAPVPGTGWGCVTCGLPADGALAVVCDACARDRAPLAAVCRGMPADGKRCPIEDLADVRFGHDMAKHPECQDAGGG